MLFVFFVAVLNLAVGYALGRGWTLDSLLERLPKRRAEAPAEDLEDDLALTQPIENEPEPEEAAPQPTPGDMMASLATFRDKLNATSIELKLKKEDPEKFEETASKLQQANHDYLEEAEGALEHLGQLGSEGDAVAAATCHAVAEGSECVAEMSGEIDGYIESGLDSEDVRTKIISAAAKLRDMATEMRDSTTVAIAEAEAGVTEGSSDETPSPSDPDPETMPDDEPPEAMPDDEPPEAMAVRTLESVEQLLESVDEALRGAEEEQVEHLAAIRLDPVEGHEEDESCRKTVAKAVERLALKSLGESHSYLQGEPAMMFLQGDSYEDAVGRVESLRKSVAATTYSYNDQQVKATITCAIADAKNSDERNQVIEQLSEALQESGAGGVNRTYHHDGAFPTPVEA